MRGVRTLVVGALSLVAADGAAADQPSLCVYHDRSYSDGAHICIQRQLMMSCTAEGGRAVWRIVEDRRLARLCATPVAAGRIAGWDPPEVRWPRHRRQTSAVPAKAQSSGKCFTFVGRRFCE